MRAKDREVFKNVAREKNVWLLVRLTNPESLKWADEKLRGNDNYIPKPISCHAKTAKWDDGKYQIAGLVADPNHHRGSFKSLSDAMRYWDEFRAAHLERDYEQTGRGREGYSVDINPSSIHFFCVRRGGKYIHADYDLLDIIEAHNPHLNEIIEDLLEGVPHNYSPLFPEIQRILNTRMDTPMVQHGAEAQFTGLYEQPIHVFFPQTGPNGENYSQCDPIIWLNQITAERWYQDWFGGRQSAKPPKPRATATTFPNPAQVIPVDFRRRQRL